MPAGAMGKPVMAKSQQWLWVLLLVWLLKPGMADMWIAWWRLRFWNGQIHFVHPGGWHELLSPWHQAAVQELFLHEPEMAAFVQGMSQLPNLGLTPFPPHWHIESQGWLTSRTREEADWTQVYVARPIDLEDYGPPGNPPHPASDGFTGSDPMRATGMGWIPGNEARDGSRHDPSYQASDGSGGASSSARPNAARDGPGGPSSSARPSRSPSRPRSFVCGWEREKQREARDGPQKASDGSKGPSPPLPKNPYRYLDRGWHSHQRRLERRKLARDGFDIPDELAPRRVEMSKTLKQHMFALQWAARRMADPSLDESELAAIEKQMQQSCEQTLDAPEPEMAEERMEVDEEEESFEVEEESCEVEVKTDSKKATARDGSKASGKQFFQMRSSKGTPSSGQERGSMGKPEMAPEVSKNKNVKEEKPEMAEKKRKKDKKSKSKSPDRPKGRDHDETGGPPGPPPPEPPTAEAVPAT